MGEADPFSPPKLGQYSFLRAGFFAWPFTSRLDTSPANGSAVLDTDYKNSIFERVNTLEQLCALLHKQFIHSQHEPTKLLQSGVIEGLVFSCELLIFHYERYEKASAVKFYKQWLNEALLFAGEEVRYPAHHKAQLETRRAHQAQLIACVSRIEWIRQGIAANVNSVTKMQYLKQTSVFSRALGELNIKRIYWIFCHFVVNQAAVLLNHSSTLSQLEKWLHHSVNLDGLIKAMNSPAPLTNLLSIGIFAGRFMADLALIVKHTLGNNLKEKSGTTPWERFCAELNKRGWNMLNNVAWGTTNLLTNYSVLCGLPAHLINPVLTAVLVFDILFIQILRYQQNKIYSATEHELVTRLTTLGEAPEGDSVETVALRKCIDSLKLQLNTLKDERDSFNQGLNFRTAAATILCVSYALTMVFAASPAAILCCYAVGLFSIAMYTSEEQFNAMLEAKKHLAFTEQQPSQQALVASRAEYQAAKQVLLFSLVEKTVVPCVLLLCYAISLPIALVLTIVYIGMKLNVSYQDNQVKRQALLPSSNGGNQATGVAPAVQQAPSQGRQLSRFSLFQPAPAVAGEPALPPDSPQP